MNKEKLKKVVALIPCYNEEGGIGDVIKSFPAKQLRQHGYDLEIVVIDNNSKDKTAEIAKSLGATVLHEPQKGKGNAIRRGFYYVSDDTDFVVMLDGDNTYRPEEIGRLLEPLNSNFSDVIIGSRLSGRISDGSMNTFNRLGNWMFSQLVRVFYRVNVTDVLTGYFAWTRDAIVALRPHLKSEGFAIEMEMITKMARLSQEIYSVPISYNTRAGESNLNPVKDGYRILCMFLRNLLWQPKTKPPRRIAFVSDAVFPYHIGGKETRLYEITKRLVSPEREIHIYTMKWWSGPKVVRHEGVYYHALCKLHPLYINNRRSMLQAVLFGFATFKMLFAKFDVIDVDHMPYFPLFSARIVTWVKRKKLHATWHEVWGKEYWYDYLSGPSAWIGATIEYLALKLPDVIISISEHTTARLIAAKVKCQIKTVPLGVDLENIYTAKTSITKSDVIYAGRLLSHKNVDLLIKAIAIVRTSLPTINCKIVGDGPERKTLENLIKGLGLEKNVEMVGFLKETQDLYSLMKASKMLVLPSVREGFGLTVVEANAAGLPVITTQHIDNAAKDLIFEGVNGFLVEPSEHDIAEKIINILKVRGAMQPALKIERYDWKMVAQNLELILG